MASQSSNHRYPDYLNPFGSDDEIDSTVQNSTSKIKQDDYPDYLSPFGDDETSQTVIRLDDYDDSLNPFGANEDEGLEQEHNSERGQTSEHGDGNPFEEDKEEGDEEEEEQKVVEEEISIKQQTIEPDVTSKANSHQPESLESPPVPLPRTKSLLKKEQALKARQQQQLVVAESNHNHLSLPDAPSISSSTITTIDPSADNVTTNPTGSFQRKKNKRNAPPVPINFKRQVSGSLDAIEAELNQIGDKLVMIEEESNLCQNCLKEEKLDEDRINTSRSKFIELIKRKNSIVRRQKELMYRKRELKLDQIHSDIEYELRMIGNKQVSHRTAEDELREKELLGKLVEIVEEKSDIVENLNKESPGDVQEIEDALQRLEIPNVPAKSGTKDAKNSTKNSTKNCDTGSIAIGTKFSKLATLIPKSSTIKIKRKRLFKKSDSRSIER